MNLVVVGDSLLDVDLLGSASRLCPDAPVPVLELEHRRRRPGGAALAATLAAALAPSRVDGGRVVLVTALASDEAGQRLREELGRLDAVTGPAPGATPVKTRLRCAGQSLCRIDEGGGAAAEVTDDMLDAVCAADAVLVSDYGRGIAADRRLRDLLRRLASTVPVVWDPHPRGPAPVPGVQLATPNLAEATRFADVDEAEPVAAGSAAATLLRQRWSAGAVAVTLGGRGAALDNGESPMVVPAPRVAVTDPCGAGDSFAAAAAVELLAGQECPAAVWAAVHEAARFVAGGGVSTLDREDLPSVRRENPGHDDARALAAEVRAGGGTVVATGGCFDLLHAGHIRTLSAARRLGDCLVVCLNSDRSVRRRKGAGRPVTPQAERVELLRSLSCVDAVVVFDEDTPEAVLNELRPDIWVKGGDYRDADHLPESRLLRVWGGRAVLVPYHNGRSSTRLVTALRPHELGVGFDPGATRKP